MLNLSGLIPLTGSESRPPSPSRRHSAGLGIIGAFNAASQMALLYPPGIDELMRREMECEDTRRHHRQAEPS